MRKRFAEPGAKTIIAPRQGRPATMRVLSYLLSLALFFQLATIHQHHSRAGTPENVKAAALASLGAAIGRQPAICAHDGSEPSDPGDNRHIAGCEHCAFCHSVAAGFAPPQSVRASLARVATRSDAVPTLDDVGPGRARSTGSATPRGPPPVG